MSELRNRMIRDLQLAGLVEGTRQLYVRAVRQLTAYYMVPPDRLSERDVEDYLLYVRDELGAAKGTFEPLVAGLSASTWTLPTANASSTFALLAPRKPAAQPSACPPPGCLNSTTFLCQAGTNPAKG